MSSQASESHKKLILSFILVFLVLPTIIFYFTYVRAEEQLHVAQNLKIDGFVLSPPKEIISFHLKDMRGNSFTKENLIGHWTMLFFGFTNCAKVCPSTMIALNKMTQILQNEIPQNQLPTIVMATVDPERDTTTKMKSYVTTFNPHFIGVSGDPKELAALEKQLHILAVKVPVGSGKNEYYYDHSAEILLINPNGEVQAYLSYPHQPEKMAKDYKLILSAIKV